MPGDQPLSRLPHTALWEAYPHERALDMTGVLEKASKEHTGSVCLGSHSALSCQLERVTGGPPELHLDVPQLIGSEPEHGGRHRQPDTGGGPPLLAARVILAPCGVLEHLVQLLRAPGGQVCQEVAVHTAEKAAQRVALLADRDGLAALVRVSLCLVTGRWCRWW